MYILIYRRLYSNMFFNNSCFKYFTVKPRLIVSRLSVVFAINYAHSSGNVKISMDCIYYKY